MCDKCLNNEVWVIPKRATEQIAQQRNNPFEVCRFVSVKCSFVISLITLSLVGENLDGLISWNCFVSFLFQFHFSSHTHAFTWLCTQLIYLTQPDKSQDTTKIGNQYKVLNGKLHWNTLPTHCRISRLEHHKIFVCWKMVHCATQKMGTVGL